MHAAVDRVIRSLRSRQPVASLNETSSSLRGPNSSLRGPMSEAQSEAVRDEATAFAAQLLQNYKGQLARRSLKQD